MGNYNTKKTFEYNVNKYAKKLYLKHKKTCNIKKNHFIFGIINIESTLTETIISFEHIFNIKDIMISNNNNNECCVCYEKSENKTLCKHPICKDCIIKSLKKDKYFTCPMCRKDYELKNYVVKLDK